MKITFEPSERDLPKDMQHPCVSVEIPFDDVNMQEMIDELIIPALLALGYQKETIDQYFNQES